MQGPRGIDFKHLPHFDVLRDNDHLFSSIGQMHLHPSARNPTYDCIYVREFEDGFCEREICTHEKRSICSAARSFVRNRFFLLMLHHATLLNEFNTKTLPAGTLTSNLSGGGFIIDDSDLLSCVRSCRAAFTSMLASTLGMLPCTWPLFVTVMEAYE